MTALSRFALVRTRPADVAADAVAETFGAALAGCTGSTRAP
jgi:hypothetical protein